MKLKIFFLFYALCTVTDIVIFTSLSIMLIWECSMSSWKNLDKSTQSDLLCLLHFCSFMQFHNKQAHALICSNYGNFRSSLSKAEHTIKCLKCW